MTTFSLRPGLFEELQNILSPFLVHILKLFVFQVWQGGTNLLLPLDKRNESFLCHTIPGYVRVRTSLQQFGEAIHVHFVDREGQRGAVLPFGTSSRSSGGHPLSSPRGAG